MTGTQNQAASRASSEALGECPFENPECKCVCLGAHRDIPIALWSWSSLDAWADA
jgi:hypothetical protein